MNAKPSLPPRATQDRNAHELSGEEAPPVESHREQTRGGGHRSGSRGAGTSENSDGKNKPGQGPCGTGTGVHSA